MSKGTVVIVGGGPIGLAHAWGLKKLNPNLNVIVLEKYQEYQRSHTLVMQHKALAALMHATHTEDDSNLVDLLNRLKKDPHIRTNELESVFKQLAQNNGVEINIQEVKEDSFAEQINKHDPDFIIGADGTHSVVSRCLFPADNQVKIEFDYVLQLRYEIDSTEKSPPINSVYFYQNMARYGLIGNEYVGRHDATKNKTPVTMQMMIPKEVFLQLQTLTSKDPLKPFSDKNTSELTLKDIQGPIFNFIHNYLKKRMPEGIVPDSVRISVNEAPATYAQQPFIENNTIPVVLVGDAGLGLSYFKGLNAGLESSAQFFTLLGPEIQRDGFNNKDRIKTGLTAYSDWFLKSFAPRKVKEVEQYSTWQIRAPMRIMEVLNSIQETSYRSVSGEDELILASYVTMAQENKKGHAQKIYPHRNHDLVKFAQFEYVPVQHSIKKIGKLFVDYFKPYKSTFQLEQDFKQPLVGIVNLLIGVLKLSLGIVTLNKKRFLDGFFSTLRGGLELGTTPLAWTLKPLIRSLITLASRKPLIENNVGMKRIAQIGLDSLGNATDVEPVEANDQYASLALAADLHRKFNKSHQRGQSSHLVLEEQKIFSEIQAKKASLNKGLLRQYYSLFENNKMQAVEDRPNTRLKSRIKNQTNR